MTKKTKNPGLTLRVLYVSSAGRKVVKCTPDAGKVTIGNETWKVDRNHLFPGKGKFDVVCVQGQSEAMPVWASSPITPEEFDAAAHNNLLEQVHAVAQGNRTTTVSWVQLGMLGLLFIAIIGIGIKLNGDFSDLQKSIDNLAHQTCGPTTAGCAQDTVHDPGTQAQASPQNLGHLQQQGANSP